MRRRTRSPKGSGGAASGGVRGGGRGRGRARGGSKAVKDKTGGRGSAAGNKADKSISEIDNDCVNIIADSKEIHGHTSTSGHFSRHPNGSLNPATLRLGGIPRRPQFAGPSSSSFSTSVNNNNSTTAVNLNNGGPSGPGSDYYLHKKFKKVTATVEPGDLVPNGSTSTSSTNGMVYKPKFRIKSDLEVAEEEQKVGSSSGSPLLLSGPELPAPSASTSAVNLSLRQAVSVDLTIPSSKTGKSIVAPPININPVNSSPLISSTRPPPVISSCPNSNSPFTLEPAKINKEMRIDRKSLDDRISKIIDENQSILEWPEQFTKRLKNHTGRGGSQQHTLTQNSLQRTSHLLSGGSTVELSCSSSTTSLFTSSQMSHHPRNGLLRHHSSSSSSDGMPTSGGSVELVVNNQITSSPQHLPSSANLLKTTSNSSLLPADLSFNAHHQQHEIHHHHHNGSGGIVTSTVSNSPSVSPVYTSSTSSTTTTTSTMVPKKRRRLSPTPSRLCGGEVSELPTSQSGAHGNGGKGYFQDLDMTVRVSNCGPSGAKVTIRTNNGAISGGSVVDFPKMIESSPSPAMQSNGAIFFAGPAPSSPLPLSLVTSKKPEGSLLHSPCPISERIQVQKTPKSPRGRPTKSKKLQSETTSTTTTASVTYTSASLLKLAQAHMPSELNLASANQPPIPGPLSLLSPGPSSSINHSKVEEPTTARAIQVSVRSSAMPLKSENSDPVNKSNDPAKDLNSTVAAPLTVVPTNTSQNPKRPTFLALKPVNVNSKKFEPGVLPSPETPRVAKPYNQMTINGQAYTYLGFKVSTRSSYTCLFKTQPMFIPQESDPKLSMYTNWQPRPRDPNQVEISISTNDSRVNGRKSPHHILYTSAIGKGLDTMTVSSPDNQPPISSPVCEQKTFLSGLQQQGPQVSVMPSSSSNDQASISKPLKVQVSPSPGGSSSGIAHISPPTSISYSSSSSCHSPPLSSSLISRQSAINSGSLISVASSLSPNPIMTTSTKQARRTATPPSCAGSDTSSAEESGDRRRSNSRTSEGPLPLTRKQMSEISKEQRVKIMEGGFESNEDYTYVRGRGRGRYVCEACGIRCKKPSMLRKHLKTHTDLRPYTCKLCNFSFKTKGNLTKHQKSKSHHKKCAGLGIHPESSRSLAVTGPGAFSISDTNTTDDNESDDDMDDDNGDMDEATDSQEEIDGDDDTCSVTGNERMDISGGGNGSFEKEIAQSLLDLSKATFQPRLVSHGSASVASGSDYENGGSQNGQGTERASYPYNAVIEEISNSSVSSVGETQGAAAPIDLSVKPITKGHLEKFRGYEQNAKRIKLEEGSGTTGISTVIVKESEKWEPPADEETMMGLSGVASRGDSCFNLKTGLNRNSIGEGSMSSLEDPPSSSSELVVGKMTEVKTEVTEYPDSSYLQAQLKGLHARPLRQRTESETSSCSSLGTGGTDRSTLLPSQQCSSSNGGGGGVKLHQPWLSPSERKEKKLEAIEILPSSASSCSTQSSTAPKPPAIEIRPLNVSPIPGSADGPSKFVKLSGRSDDENGSEIPPPMGPPGSLSESPNSKLFSGMTALKPQAEFRQPSGAQALVKDEGKAECNVCGKTFARASQLTLHMNIHYIERPFRCDPCGVSFRTKGHLIKHRRSSSHDCKVYLTEAWGVANEENPRPFKCPDCKIAFRIHGHLAKHLRSKMHIMRMECLGKLPFGIYFEMEKSGINLNEIDTTDCDMSLVSLQNVARKIYGEQWRERLTVPTEEPPP